MIDEKIRFNKCDLNLNDFHKYDGHPNKLGYEKITKCASLSFARLYSEYNLQMNILIYKLK